MLNIILVIIMIVLAFILGYRYCLVRNRVRDAYKLIKLFTNHMEGKTSAEDMLKQFKEIYES